MSCCDAIRRFGGVDPDDGRGPCCLYRVDGEPVPGGITLRFAVPGSDLMDATDMSMGRRALTGGTLSRSWVAVAQGGPLEIFSISHNGSRADPLTVGGQSATDLAGGTNNFVTLPAGARTSAQNAADMLTTMGVAGITGAVTDGVDAYGNTIISVPSVTSYLFGPTLDTSDPSLRGQWGGQRNNWGGGVPANTAGGTGGTLSMYIGNPGASLGRAGRILGIGCWGHTNFAPRIAVFTGPSYTPAPGALTTLAEGVMTAVTDYGTLWLQDPVEFASTDELWIAWRSNGVGGPMFRNHGLVPQGSGDMGAGQVSVWDTASPSGSGTAFGATYTPIIATTFNIYMQLFIIYELRDASGYYSGDGRIYIRFGDQNNDDEHGTQFAAGPALLDGETTHHRVNMFQWTGLFAVQTRRAVDAITVTGVAREDSTVVWYGPWANLAFPVAPAPALINAPGPMLISTPNDFNDLVYASEIPVGTDALGANAITTMGFNYVTDDGSALATYTLPVFIDSFTGSGSYLNCWEDAGREWHDYIPGASGRVPTSGVIEYRTQLSGGSTMPTTTPVAPWPDPFAPNASDSSPNAIALDLFWLYRPGFAVVP